MPGVRRQGGQLQRRQGQGDPGRDDTSSRSAAASPSSPTNYWAASQGAQALQVTWDEGPLANLSSAEINKKQAELAQQPGKVARNDGNAEAALDPRRSGPTGPPARTFERVFEAPFLAHACMEPMNCTADVQADSCDVYVPTQGQTASQQAAMAASKLPADKVSDPHHLHGRRIRPARRSRLRHGRGGDVEGCWQAGEGRVDARGRHAARLLSSGQLRAHVGGGRRERASPPCSSSGSSSSR